VTTTARPRSRPPSPAPVPVPVPIPPPSATSPYAARHTPAAGGMLDLPREWIMPSTINPRTHFDRAALEELATSLKEHGMLEPVVVRPIADVAPDGPPPYYSLIAGERRWRAAALAAMETVPARILEGVDDRRALALALIENLQRRDLDPIEEAEGYRRLRDQASYTQSEIGRAVNRTQPAIAKAIGLLDLPEDVRELIRAGALSVAHGAALLRFKAFPTAASAIAAQAVATGATSKNLESSIPDSYALQRAGLLQILFTPFAACKGCPFDARKKDSYHSVCLNPSHWKELNTAAARQRQQPSRDAAATPDGAPAAAIPHLRDLASDTYERCEKSYGYPVPEACTAACPCRGQAQGYQAEAVPICTDPARYKGLRDEETARRDAVVKAEVAADLEGLARHVDTRPLHPMQVALMLRRMLQWGTAVGPLRAATHRHAPALWDKSMKELTAEQLATLPIDTQLKLVFEIQTRKELAEWASQYRYAGDPDNPLRSYPFYGWLRSQWASPDQHDDLAVGPPAAGADDSAESEVS